MTDRARPLGRRSGSAAKPSAILGAVFLSLILLLLFGLVSHANW